MVHHWCVREQTSNSISRNIFVNINVNQGCLHDSRPTIYMTHKTDMKQARIEQELQSLVEKSGTKFGTDRQTRPDIELLCN